MVIQLLHAFRRKCAINHMLLDCHVSVAMTSTQKGLIPNNCIRIAAHLSL